MSGPATANPAVNPSLTRTRALLALLALGGLALAATSATWVTTEVATALRPDVAVAATGAEAAPVVSAAALVLLACGPALALTGRAGRYLVLAVAALAGTGVTAGALAVVADPDAAGTAAAADTAGVTDLTGPVVLSPWPWTAAATGVLTLLLAVAAALSARRWPRASRRHERDGAPGGTRSTASRPPESPEAGAPASRSPEAASSTPASGPDEPDPADDWDALTRGEDPTRDDR